MLKHIKKGTATISPAFRAIQLLIYCPKAYFSTGKEKACKNPK